MFIILVTCGSCRFCLRGNYEVCNQSAIYGFSPKVLVFYVQDYSYTSQQLRNFWMVQKKKISNFFPLFFASKVSGGNGSVHDLHTKFEGPSGARKCWSNFGCLCRGKYIVKIFKVPFNKLKQKNKSRFF